MGAASRRSIGLLRLPGFLCSYVLMNFWRKCGVLDIEYRNCVVRVLCAFFSFVYRSSRFRPVVIPVATPV